MSVQAVRVSQKVLRGTCLKVTSYYRLLFLVSNSHFSFLQCFQAGVICGGKCKCADCQNYAGSQALIDKRRKIKDQRGADFAMRVADEAWKGTNRKRTAPPPPAPPARRIAHGPSMPIPSPATGRLHPTHMMHASPRGPPAQHGGSHHPHYMSHHGMMMGPPMGGSMGMGGMAYSPMGMPPMTPVGYQKPLTMSHGDHRGMYPPTPAPGIPTPAAATRPLAPLASAAKTITPVAPITVTSSAVAVAATTDTASKTTRMTPRTPGIRVKFDPASSRKKLKLSPGSAEPTYAYFGTNTPEQTKTTALAVFSFLSNSDVYNASLVSKKWSQLAVDEELWKFTAIS
jgi:hypothetical protein